ncbi:hypothetical protein HH610_002630 [Escherichia coli]|nr:hypothetical protein [Escherichia coli]EFI3808775.1 hypothetical protein [Escherichia coli]EFI3847381.1 hypothetical protein [Escherichia coli]EFI8980857.1 hypothetical protein [Escherichia coli]EFJ0489269.1 hypothetical protein [Escherichia coli]
MLSSGFLNQLFPLTLCSLRMLLGHPFIYTFYEIMGSLTKYRLSVILYGRKDMRLILQIPKVESL